jgi:hypothetical protein
MNRHERRAAEAQTKKQYCTGKITTIGTDNPAEFGPNLLVSAFNSVANSYDALLKSGIQRSEVEQQTKRILRYLAMHAAAFEYVKDMMSKADDPQKMRETLERNASRIFDQTVDRLVSFFEVMKTTSC